MTQKENQFLEELYHVVNKENASENPFDTEELNQIYNSFIDKYINDLDEEDEFMNVMYGYCKQGFKIGYIIAKTLSTPKDLTCLY